MGGLIFGVLGLVGVTAALIQGITAAIALKVAMEVLDLQKTQA